MQELEVRNALRSLDPAASPSWGEIEEIPGGWSHWTFAVEPECIFRFPKTPEVANRLRKEIRLLPELADCVSFAVPRFEWVGVREGAPFVGYRRLDGRALEPSDVAMSGAAPVQKRAHARERLAQVLAELHGFPKQRASRLLQVRDGIEAWTARYAALHGEVERRVLPLLEQGLRAGLQHAAERFREEGLPHFSHPVLVHCDLGTSHLLVDAATGHCSGVLDFETATLGDPVIDFVGLWISHGPEVTGDVLARYGGPHDSGFGERLHFYQWMGSVQAILHGLDTDDEALVQEAVDTLAVRLERPALGDRLSF